MYNNHYQDPDIYQGAPTDEGPSRHAGDTAGPGQVDRSKGMNNKGIKAFLERTLFAPRVVHFVEITEPFIALLFWMWFIALMAAGFMVGFHALTQAIRTHTGAPSWLVTFFVGADLPVADLCLLAWISLTIWFIVDRARRVRERQKREVREQYPEMFARIEADVDEMFREMEAEQREEEQRAPTRHPWTPGMSQTPGSV